MNDDTGTEGKYFVKLFKLDDDNGTPMVTAWQQSDIEHWAHLWTAKYTGEGQAVYKGFDGDKGVHIFRRIDGRGYWHEDAHDDGFAQQIQVVKDTTSNAPEETIRVIGNGRVGSLVWKDSLMGEITWREGTGEPTSTRTFLVVVENDVNRGTEGVPTSAVPAYPAPQSLVTVGGSTPAVTVTALTANQTTFDPATVTMGITIKPTNNTTISMKTKILLTMAAMVAINAFAAEPLLVQRAALTDQAVVEAFDAAKDKQLGDGVMAGLVAANALTPAAESVALADLYLEDKLKPAVMRV